MKTCLLRYSVKHSIEISASVVLASALLPVAALGSTDDDRFFQSLQNSSMTVLSPEQCATNMSDLSDPKWIKENSLVQMNKILSPQITSASGWTPTGALDQPNNPNCTSQMMLDTIYNGSGAATDQAGRVSQFFNACGDSLNGQNAGPLTSLIGIVTAKYDVCHAPRIRNVVFNLPDGTIVRGLLGMQNSSTEKRPIVIAKGGVFANTGDLSHKLLLMHLFDEGIFNVLVLSSSSSAEYIRDNGRVAVGGYEEGVEMMRIADILKSGPAGQWISSYHVAGLSLGGNAAMFASAFNDMYEAPPISSFLSICPVVDLQTSMHDLFGDPVKGPLAQTVLAFALSTIADTDPQFQPIASSDPSSTPDLVAQYSTDFYNTRLSGWELPIVQNPIKIETAPQFWLANNFLNQISTPRRTPQMLIAAADDWVVNSAHNTEVVSKLLANANQSQLGTVETPHGNHCAFSMAYGWSTISNLFRGYILSHSAELKPVSRSLAPKGINLANILRLGSSEKNWNQRLQFFAGRNHVRATFEIWTGDGFDCSPSDITQASAACRRTVTTTIPISALSASWAKIPENATQAESLTRWANTNLRWKTASGMDVFGQGRPPALLSWTDYQLQNPTSVPGSH